MKIINSLPQYKMYWHKDMFLGNDGIKRTMPISRYEKLTQYLHVSDRASEPRHEGAYDKLYKIRPIITMTKKHSKNVTTQGKPNCWWGNDCIQRSLVLNSVLASKANKMWCKAVDEMWCRIWLLAWIWCTPWQITKLTTWPGIWCSHKIVWKHSWAQPSLVLW